MNPTPTDVVDIVDAVATSYLHMPAQLSEAPSSSERDPLTAFVTVNGAWRGTLTITCSRTFARRVAVAMFALPDGTVSDDEVRDSLGELCNMVGGNLKSLFASVEGQGYQLSLPTVAEGAVSVVGGQTVMRIWVRVGVDPICISLLEPRQLPARGSA